MLRGARSVGCVVILAVVGWTRLAAANPADPLITPDLSESAAPVVETVDDRWLPPTAASLEEEGNHAATDMATTQSPRTNAPQVPVPAAVWTGLILLVSAGFIARSHTAARWRRALLH